MTRSILLLAVLFFALPGEVRSANTWDSPEIEAGFRLLYELRFREARSVFRSWRTENPGYPLGDVALAASHLFEEFYHHGVLTSEFFLDDERLLDGIDGEPDPESRAAFLDFNQQAQDLAQQQLRDDPQNPEALFALTLSTGMMADYAGLIEKRHLASLRYAREAEDFARKLLAVRPDSADAYLALGAANYLLGSLPWHKRAILWLGGISGNRQDGMRQLGVTAEEGHYLKPFAKILLALTALREKQPDLTRRLLRELTAEFPTNPLFRRELSLLDGK